MAPEDAIRAGIHGEVVGIDIGVTDPILACDYTHSNHHLEMVIAGREVVPIEYESPVLYECIRVVDIPLLERFGAPNEWILDAARCEACAVEALPDPTNGYEEALISVGINASGGVLTVDAADFELLDYSPASEGLEPPGLPLSVVTEIFKWEDFGGFRRSRVAILPEMLRAHGVPDLVEQIETELAATRR